MRDYDPTTGRYLEPDPLGLVDGASVYGYARQNPGRWVDPRGESALGLVSGTAGADLLKPDKSDLVIPPFLTGCIRRIHAAIFSFWAGVMPPMPMFGRSLL